MQHRVMVRNNDTDSSYGILMDLSEESAIDMEKFGMRLAEESGWSLSLTVFPETKTSGAE